MEALLLDDAGLRYDAQVPDPAVPPGHSKLRVLQAGICETDLQLAQGYMGFSGIPGHEFVAVAETGPLAGQRVVAEINCPCGTCDLCTRGLGSHCPQRTVVGILNHNGAFAEWVVVPDSNLHAVPDSLSDDLATLTEPVAAALQIPEQLDLSGPGRTGRTGGARSAIVLGDGRLGNLCSQVLAQAGCDVLAVGKHAFKLSHIAAAGIPTCLVDDIPPGLRGDVVVDCTGSPSGLDQALRLVRPRGTVVMKTTVADPHRLSLAPVVIDEITLLGSRCGPFAKALHALASGCLQLDGFVTDRFPLRDFAAAFESARSGRSLKVIFDIASPTHRQPG